MKNQKILNETVPLSNQKLCEAAGAPAHGSGYRGSLGSEEEVSLVQGCLKWLKAALNVYVRVSTYRGTSRHRKGISGHET